MVESSFVPFEPGLSDDLRSATEKAVKLSEAAVKPVKFEFMNIPLTVTAETKFDDIADEYARKWDDRQSAIRNSAEGKAFASEQQRAVIDKQAKIDGMMGQLGPALAQGLTPTIQWLKDYAVFSDDMTVNTRGGEVAKALTGAGYSATEKTPDPYLVVSKETAGRQLVGKAVEYLQSSFPLNKQFISASDQYLSLPDKPKPGAPAAKGPV